MSKTIRSPSSCGNTEITGSVDQAHAATGNGKFKQTVYSLNDTNSVRNMFLKNIYTPLFLEAIVRMVNWVWIGCVD